MTDDARQSSERGVAGRIAQLFDAHASPAFASKADVHGAAGPLLEMGALVQQQLAEYRRHLMAVELADGSDALTGKLEHIHQTLQRIEADAGAFVASGRQLARGFTQLGRYMPQAQADIEAHLARQEAGDAG